MPGPHFEVGFGIELADQFYIEMIELRTEPKTEKCAGAPRTARRIRLFAAGLVVFLSLASNSFANNCVFFLNRTPLKSFEKIKAQLKVTDIKSNFGSQSMRLVVSDQLIVDFWKRSWPTIERLAMAEDATLKDFFEERMALYELGVSAYHSANGAHKNLSSELTQGFRYRISQLIKMGTPKKMKPSHWELVRDAYLSLIDFGMVVSVYESNIRRSPTFDPLSHLSPDRLMATLRAAQDISLDVIQRKAEAIELERLEKQIALLDYRSQRDASNGDAESAVESSDPNGQLTAPASPATENVPSQAQNPEINSRWLSVALQEGQPLLPNHSYEAATIRGQKLEVVLSESIVDAAQGPHRQVVFRLLRTIFTGRGDQAGIKLLSDIGNHIVEIKAVMRGSHRRILGCLKGSRLYLRAFMEMGDSRAAYSRVIDRNFCQ